MAVKGIIQKIYPLTPMQSGILFHSLIGKNSTVYIEQHVLEIKGEIDKYLLEKSLNIIIDRYDVLRTVFRVDKVEEPLQLVLRQRKFKLYFQDISLLPGDEKSLYMEDFLRKDREKGFNLTKDILVRLSLFKTGLSSYSLVWNFHHIIMDGWCLGIIFNELLQVYRRLKEGKTAILEPITPYSEYIKWLGKQEKIGKQVGLNYWREYLAGFEEPVDLPWIGGPGRPVRAVKDAAESEYRVAEYFLSITEGLTSRLNKAARQNLVTISTVFQALWGIVLQRYSNRTDVVFGVVVSGRPPEIEGIEHMVGIFINTVPLRVKVQEEEGFWQVVQNLHAEAAFSRSYEYLHLTEIQSVSLLKGNLIDHIMAFENLPIQGQLGNENMEQEVGFAVEGIESHEQTNYHLNVIVYPRQDLTVKFNYNALMYESDFIKNLGLHLKKVILQVVENPGLRVQDFDIVTVEEKRQILIEFNRTAAEYPKNKAIHGLFEEQVERTPDNIAVVAPSIGANHETPLHITYKELNKKSNRGAHILQTKGLDPDTNPIVGIMVERSVEMIVGILGILKAGGAYLPIDSGYPEDRIDYMVTDSNAKILLNKSEIRNSKFESPRRGHPLKNLNEKNTNDQNKNFGIPLVLNFENLNFDIVSNFGFRASKGDFYPSNLAYIIYTSGSTGKPKGVMVEHRSVIRLVKNSNYIKFDNGDRILQTGALSFDASTFEIWGSLLNGLELVLLPEERVLSFEMLKRDLITFCISTIWMTAPLFNQMVDADEEIFAGLRNLIVGGDVLSTVHINRVHKKFQELNIINGYGPTENTTFSTTYLIDKEYKERIPIGKPITNSTAYIVDKSGNLQPIGIVGEIWVGGDGVSRGYLNNPELTAEKFGFSPLSPNKLYKTGDLGRWLSDGNIEFLGRIDYQIKIRGFRVELGEIENCLLNYPGIKEAVVLAREEEKGDKYLCAYIISESELVTSELREYISKEMPDYMVPSYFVQMEKIPVTSNGKIDRRALPKPELKIGESITAPRNEIEKKLVKLWSEILGRDAMHSSQLQKSIGIDDNFFLLGGHSLKATVLASRIHKGLNVILPLAEFFKTPTIRGLAEYIKGTVKDLYKSIMPVEEKEYYLLSFSQKRMYILQQIDLNSTAYNMPQNMPLPEEVDIVRLEESFKKLIKRHDSLRTSFHMIGDQPVQKVHKEVAFKIEKYEKLGVHRFLRAFDLSHAPLLRVGELKTMEGRNFLLVDMHHIISDGISHQVLKEDFMALYEGKELPPLRLQYKDFSEWQNGEKERESLKLQEEYWLKELEGEIPVLEIPTDYPRPVSQSFEGDSIDFEISAEDTQALNVAALQNGATLFMVLAAAVNILLSKLSNQDEIIIGIPIADRRHPDLEKIIGIFVNTLALRNYPTGDRIFKEFLGDIKERVLMAFENQEYPFEELVDKLSLKRDMGRNPLFDAMFVLQNMNTGSIDGKEASQSKIHRSVQFVLPQGYENMTQTAKFDLTFIAVELGPKTLFSIQYCTKLFKKETIKRFILYFKEIVAVALKEQCIRISDIEIISEEEKRQILYIFNGTETEYPKDKTIHQLFEEQVKRVPDRIAAFGRGRTRTWSNTNNNIPMAITYQELHDQSKRLAYLLIEKGVLTDTIVSIMVERSLEMIIGILGILKAGGAYLPIDPGYPEERIDFMLKDSGAKLLVTNNNKEGEEVRGLEGEKVLLEEIFNSPKSSTYPLMFLPSYLQNSSNLAYIIYTSGSTGKPKGVMVEHRSVIRLVKNSNYIKFNNGDRILQTGALSFDASTFEIWGSLLNGLELVLLPEERVLNLEMLKQDLITFCISTIWMTAPLFNQMVDADEEIFAGLRNLIVGGDVLSAAHINRIHKKFQRLNIINGYGPTENTTFSTTYLIDKEYKERIPIGKPITNSMVYIVDKSGNLQPLGIVGEIWVGGDGVSRGYLNNPELTAQKFGFFHMSSNKLYKTGDLGRWLSDGNIEFLGRIDHQIKIRGFRIELGEIENCLLNYPGIKEAVVLAREEEKGDKYLCAYIISDNELVTSELWEYLATEIPDYMIPSYFVRMEKIPVTSNGKINRRALPKPELKIGENYTAPRNEIERKLVKLWSKVLARDTMHSSQLQKSIGIDDNFFQLGGHSLNATILVSKIHKVFDVKVPLMEIFKTPRIREFAAYIKGAAREKHFEIEPVEEREYYYLSSAQKRLYILQQMNLDSIAYNMPEIIFLPLEFYWGNIEETFKKLIKRHESLRTSFHLVNDIPAQKIQENVEFKIEILETKVFGPTFFQKGGPPEAIIKFFIHPFNLSQAPLLRVGLVKLDEEKYILLIDMHHIISDGVSHKILVKDFQAFYRKEELPPLRVQYKDFSEWQKREKEEENFKLQEEYWLREFEGEIPVLELPTDYPRPLVQSFEGKSFSFELSDNETNGLKHIAVTGGVTLYMVLLALYNVLLARLTNQEDIIIGTPIAGRRHADLEKAIGMFVNTLALRNYPEGHKDLDGFLTEVGERTLEAFENQEYQFEDLVEKMLTTRDAGRNPVFDTMFTLDNLENKVKETSQAETTQFKIKPYELESGIAKFDLILSCAESEEKLVCSFDYCIKLFKEDAVQRFAAYFKQVVSVIIENRNKKISEVEIITGEEKRQLLYEFNDTVLHFPAEKNICRLFEEQVARTPDGVALHISHISHISYSELNRNSDCLAHLLSQGGVQPGTIVGLMAERSPEMITGILGIWKVGCAYAPLNPKAPTTRNEYMLKECCVSTLITTRRMYEEGEKMRGWGGEIVINEEFLNFSQPLTCISSYLPNALSLAYVIFTSGSTGSPKGVLITHANLSPLLHWGYYHLGIGAHDRALQNLSYYFDWSVWEIFITLTTGASLYIVPEDIILEAAAGVDFINRHDVTILHVTPTQYQYIVKAPFVPVTLKYLFIGAEKLTYDLVERSFASVSNVCRVFNMYGPTEATIISAVLEIHRESLTQFASLASIPIGKVAGNNTHLILDRYMNLCPVNIAGELYIGGDGVSMGYLNNPELTAEKFNRSYKSYKDYIFYKTGDLVRWLPSGNIEYLGRIDQQVKIRGFRIEPEEIENHLLKHPDVKEAKVLDKIDKSGDKYLCAYIVSERLILGAELKEYLSGRLPGYMVPTYFELLDRIPLTPNGKIDRKALREPGITPGEDYAAPKNEIEEKIATIWSEVLGIEKSKLDVNANFFDSGGHSLKATVMVAKIHKVFGLKLQLLQVFRAPTIRGIALLIEAVDWLNTEKSKEPIFNINVTQESEEIIL